jgi:hypothetical protein
MTGNISITTLPVSTHAQVSHTNTSTHALGFIFSHCGAKNLIFGASLGLNTPVNTVVCLDVSHSHHILKTLSETDTTTVTGFSTPKLSVSKDTLYHL